MKHLYPPSHPVAVVQLVTFEKLLENVHGQEMPFPFAIATLRNAIAGAEVGLCAPFTISLLTRYSRSDMVLGVAKSDEVLVNYYKI